jgi:hypothetical protein
MGERRRKEERATDEAAPRVSAEEGRVLRTTVERSREYVLER